ncbi:MAG: LacI family DNA-binding transcriptional regulator [Armatimonadota bacterium]
MTTVRELANLAGVSRSTVSRALTGALDVNPDTRARILELATRFQYRSNRPASATGVLTIGCIVPRISSLFFVGIIKGVVQAAFREMCHVIPLETRSIFDTTRLAISTLIEQRVAGILIASGHAAPIPREDIMRMWSAGIVPVSIDCPRTDIPIDTVQTDWPQFAELIVNHFITQGHRYILPFAFSTLPQTVAIRQCLRQVGYPEIVHDDTWLSLSPAEKLRNILAMNPRPTALIAGNVEGAVQIVAAATRSGLEIPGDLSVLASYNAGFWLEACTPPISAIEQFPEEIGKRAFDLLYRRMTEGCYRPAHPEIINIAPQLVVRASTGPPRNS